MHTKDKLAAALREIGLDAMADKAATGYWHDYLSPLASPMADLVARLAVLRSTKTIALAVRVMKGEFDASKEEAEAWGQTPEGRRAAKEIERLMNRGKR